MPFDLDALATIEPAALRRLLPEWVVAHVSCDEAAAGRLRSSVGAALAPASDAELRELVDRFADAGREYRLYPAVPLARAITRAFMGVLAEGSRVVGAEHLERFLADAAARRIIVCNHVSYTDTQVTDVLLAAHGFADAANRMVAIAGPKVYTEAWRRMAAIGLNTRKTAQSSAVASEQGALSARELAAIALEALADVERLSAEGYIVLLYPEGTRSRTGELQPFLRAAARYLAMDGARVLPMHQSGCQRMFPIGSEVMFPTPVTLSLGPAFTAAEYPGKVGALEEARRRLDALAAG